jgi:hypothetical protein
MVGSLVRATQKSCLPVAERSQSVANEQWSGEPSSTDEVLQVPSAFSRYADITDRSAFSLVSGSSSRCH